MKHNLICAGIIGAALVGLPAAGLTQEAPILAEQVAAGTLPALAERLPTNPRVVTPEQSIGKYGGTWRSSLAGGGDHIWLLRINTHETLVSWDRAWSGAIIPNVAESFEANEDANIYSFTLREGMKWSDGADFGVDDIRFYFEDVASNSDLLTNVTRSLFPGGKLPAFEQTGPNSFSLAFDQPHGLFPIALSTPDGGQLVVSPKHYCSQFHADYNSDADQMAKDAGLSNWSELYLQKCYFTPTSRDFYLNAERPTLSAWAMETAYTGETQQVNFVRNPYYWRVDTDGNQLPYIDRHQVTVNNDKETVVLSALNGELDFQDRHINAVTNRGLFLDGSEEGNYRLVNQSVVSNTSMLALNLTTPNALLNDVFNRKDFRIGLSHAIDRGSIIEALNFGLGEPAQAAPAKNTPFYNEQLEKQYTEYDLEKAETAMLKAGLTRDDGGFWSLDGERITFACSIANNFFDLVPTAELVINYWQDMGVDARLNSVDRTNFYDQRDQNTLDCGTWTMMATGPDVVVDPRILIPTYEEAIWGIGWANWYTESEGAVEPPAAVKKALDLYSQVATSGSEETRNALMSEITDIAAEEFWVMGISTMAPSYIVVNDDMRNVPEPSVAGWNYLSPSLSGVEQFYFDR